MDLSFRLATTDDCGTLATMINEAYRGPTSKKGWTTESHLLDGLRTDKEDLLPIVGRADSNILMAYDSEKKLIGSVHLEKRPDQICYLGMFTVNPLLQAKGIGRDLLANAEKFAWEIYQAKRMQMTVITARKELIEWYERRGYRRTGKTIPFPIHEKFGIVKTGILEMEYLEKSLG
jgi:ribosomal protein S18 acetylase RimI-like enzyme